MKKVYLTAIVALVLLSLVLGIMLHRYKNRIEEISYTLPKTDTVYVDKPFKSVKEYKYIEVPKLVMFYNQPEVKIDTVYVDSVRIHYVIPSGNLDFNHQFLLKYPDSQKLVQLVTSKNTLQLTQLDKNGLIHTDSFVFYPEINHYNYQDMALTYKRKPLIQRFDIGMDVMVRPMKNMYDLNLYLKYKTRKTNYEIGLSTYYYPALEPGIRYTPFLRLGLNL